MANFQLHCKWYWTLRAVISSWPCLVVYLWAVVRLPLIYNQEGFHLFANQYTTIGCSASVRIIQNKKAIQILNGLFVLYDIKFLAIHSNQKLFVSLSAFHLLYQKVHSFFVCHVGGVVS